MSALLPRLECRACNNYWLLIKVDFSMRVMIAVSCSALHVEKVGYL